MPIQKMWNIRIALCKKNQEFFHILHNSIEGGEMSARAARFAVATQIKADQCIARVCHYPANMSITPGMFSQPMDEREQCPGMSIRLPALHEESNAIIAFPF